MKFKSLFGFLLLLSGSMAYAQDLTVVSTNGTSSTIDITSIESIVFTNNNLVVHTTECQDNYFSIYYTQTMDFDGSSLGLDSKTANQQLSVYPNPATDLITVQVPEAVNGSLTLSNIQGSVVMTAAINGDKSSVDVSVLPAGIYFIGFEQQLVKFIKR